LLASQNTYILDPQSPENLKSIPGFTDTIHSIVVQPRSSENPDASVFVAAAQGNRNISIYNAKTCSLLGNLIAEDEISQLVFPGVTDASYNDPEYLESLPLASICETGKIGLFKTPFRNAIKSKTDLQNQKSSLKGTTRHQDTIIEVRRPGKGGSLVPVLNVLFQNTDIVLAISEGSTDVSFKTVPCLDKSGGLALGPLVTIEKAKSVNLTAETTNGVKDIGRTHVDESRAVVSEDVNREDGIEFTQKVSNKTSDSEQGDDSDVEMIEKSSKVFNDANTNGVNDVHSEFPGDHSDIEMAEDKQEEPSFGEMLRNKGIGTVDVINAFPDNSNGQTIVSSSQRKLDAASALSLATVLTQALNKNDSQALEDCFAVEDLRVVRATIERIKSDLAIKLLQDLAERLHSRPGRVGSLLVWVQWTLVAHGGYLSSRPDTAQRLSSLHKVISQRAKGLQPLLTLKGKLDMLEAQVNLRRSLQQNHAAISSRSRSAEDLIYVEGQEDSSSDSEGENQDAKLLTNGVGSFTEFNEQDEDSSDEDKVMREADETEVSDDGNNDDLTENEEDTSSDIFDEDDLDEEVNHDDVDPLDSDDSDDGIASKVRGKGKVNGIKPRKDT
jgi:U3 small nucleolar RNA-associated protein 5